jgi:hypothetical protein
VRRPWGGCDEGGGLILRGNGAGNLTEMASHGEASVEEGGSDAGACRRASCLKLGDTSSAAPRGCSGTCSRGRESTERGC